MKRVVAVGLLAIGCGPSQAGPVEADVPRRGSEVMPSSTAPRAAAEPSPEALPSPTWPVCRVLGERPWENLPLRLSPEGPDGFELGGPFELEIALPLDGDPTRVLLAARGDGVELQGFTDPKRVRLFVREPVMFGRIAVPYASTALSFEGHRGGDPVVALPADSAVDLPAPLEQPVPCPMLALESQISHDGFPPDASFATIVRFPLPLAADVGGGPVATLRGQPPRAALLLERADGRTRIGWHGDVATYIGWVDGTAVQAGTSPAGIPGTSHRTKFARAILGPLRARRCDETLPVVAKVGGETLPVGEITAGTVWRGGPPRDELVDVSVRFLRPLDGARLVVEQARLSRCEEVDEPAP